VKIERRAAFVVLGATVAAFLIALPALGVDPTAKPSQKPEGPKATQKAAKPDESEAPEVTITVHGLISKTTDAEGEASFTMTANGKTYQLEVGPPWWWGANNPLASKAGGVHDVTGEVEGSSNEIDVLSIDGTAVRQPGRPPWAGGPKEVGSKHPGWKAWKAAHDGTKGPNGPKANEGGQSPAPNATPGSTPAPAGTAQPSATQAPTATPVPTVTIEPTATTEPTGTNAPTATSAPTGTGQPTATAGGTPTFAPTVFIGGSLSAPLRQ